MRGGENFKVPTCVSSYVCFGPVTCLFCFVNALPVGSSIVGSSVPLHALWIQRLCK